MNKKILFGLLTLMFLIVITPLVSATVEDDFNRVNSTTLGTATNGNTWSVTETSDVDIQISDNELFVESLGSGSIWSMQIDFNVTNPSQIDWMMKYPNTCGDYHYFEWGEGTGATGNNAIRWIIDRSSSCVFEQDNSGWSSLSYTTDNQWHNYSIRNINYVSDTYELWVDGVQKGGTNNFEFNKNIEHFYLNANVNMDDILIDCITTNGDVCVEESSSNVTLTVVDEWNASNPVNNVSATINGDTFINTTGNILYTNISENASQTYDIELSAEYFFDKTYSSSTMESKTLSMFQSEIDFETLELVTNNTLSNLTYTVDGQTNTTFHLSEGSYTVLVQKTGYYDLNHTFNVSALDNRTETVTGLYNTILSVNLTDVVTTDLIEETSYMTLNDGAGYEETFSNTNGSLSANLIQGTYNLTLWANDYAFRYESITINDTTKGSTYALYANNSVWITAVDFNDGSSLNNFSVEIYDANTSYSGSDANTGTAKMNNITSGVYTLRVDKDGYASAEYPLTMTGGSHQNVIAYLVASGSETIFTVVDSISGGIIEGAQVSMYKTINSTWTLVSSQDTDITGRVQFSYIPNIEYKFELDADGYEQRTFFLEPLFSTYTVRLTPDTQSEPDENVGKWVYAINNSGNFYDDQNNSFTISITSGTGTIEYYYLNVTDPDGVVANVSCFVASGCSNDFVLEILDANFNESVVVEFWIKESGRAEKYFKKPYIVQGVYNDNSLFGWKDQDDVGDLEKIFAATIICLVIVGVFATGSVLLGAPPITVSGIALGVLIEILAYVDFVPDGAAHLIALGCVLIVIFGRGEI